MLRKLLALGLSLAVAIGPLSASSTAEDPLDPARDLALPCEAVNTPGLFPRSAQDISHLANVCGFVGTDIEFQSRTLADGSVRDYAFVGTMGAGTRIFDITDPAHPKWAGGYFDPGYQNDVQVRGDLLVLSFDPLAIASPKTSNCLLLKSATSGGSDLVRLHFDAVNGTFTTSLIDCVPTLGGSTTSQNGAHNATIHPSGKYLVMINPRGNGSVDVVDLRGATPFLKWRVVQSASLTHTTCTALAAPARCISTGRAGTWSPHDVSFSRGGDTMYVAAVSNDSVLVDVSRLLDDGLASVIGIAPNNWHPDPGVGPWDVSISHQADTSSDGEVLIVTDERGGGVTETGCNRDGHGIIGGAHFWSLGKVGDGPSGSPSAPARLGAWYYPNPVLEPDPLADALVAIGRTERACTIHVFRPGGNGTAGPGPIQRGYDGVSGLPKRQLVSAHYGAGVWHIDFSGPSSSTDGVAEDWRSTWGNTLAWNVMPGAETWSAKEYKGYIYAGDMARGFDVYRFEKCVGKGCANPRDRPKD